MGPPWALEAVNNYNIHTLGMMTRTDWRHSREHRTFVSGDRMVSVFDGMDFVGVSRAEQAA